MTELILIRGLPGSGKTTLAHEYVALGYEHHEADHYFEKNGDYKFDRAKLNAAHSQCLARTLRALRRGKNCVVSNTFSQWWEMEPYLNAAMEADAVVRIIETKGNFQNVHGVPPETIERMRTRWESIPTEPSP